MICAIMLYRSEAIYEATMHSADMGNRNKGGKGDPRCTDREKKLSDQREGLGSIGRVLRGSLSTIAILQV